MIRAGIVGGSGFTGGELLRLLHFHPDIEVMQITSRENAGKFAYSVHPNMRGVNNIQFVHPDALAKADVLFLAVPHGHSAANIERYAALAPKIVDLSADFRLQNLACYEKWYGQQHPNPAWLERFVYGLPEFRREQLRGANYASGVGCNATTLNLALAPIVREGLVNSIHAELKVGSSEGGNTANAGSHHPIRSGAVRTYAATNHRHMAEAQMIMGETVPLRFSVTAIEMVRGIHLLAHVELNKQIAEKDLWRIYRGAYRDEPFIRLVASKTGLHRLPEPRIVAGTNFCDIGFELSDDGQHAVIIATLDNLGKGAAGSAVQSMNLMFGLDECAGLGFSGIYP